MQKWNDVEVEEQRFTTWRNPTKHEMKVDIYDRPGRRRRYVVRPDEEVQIPSEHDRAIHDIRDGVIVGGYAPLLERVSGHAVLSPVLDPDAAALKDAEAQADRVVIAKKAADDVLARTQAPAPPAPAEKSKK